MQPLELVLVVLGLLAGALVTRRARGDRPMAVIGGIVLAGAVWLFAQRTDTGARVILAVLGGGGIGLIVGGDSAATGQRKRNVWTAAVLIVALVGFGAYVGAETPTAHWFGGGITHGPRLGNGVALTFDDGPNLSATLPIMRILDAAGVKGTFFEVGKAIDAEPQITRALHANGQLLGNHSYHHDQWRWLDPRYPELERTQRAFERAIGTCPTYYRPPHGDRTPFIAHVASNHHMRIVMWNDASGDWALKDPRTIARRIVRGAKPGSIIVLHDGLDGDPTADRRVLVRALPLILEGLRSKHLNVVPLDKLIGGPAFRPC